MEKVCLVDGNNLMFRAYYATAYSGNIMKNSKSFPTNALYGFVNMMHKIIEEEKPKYIMVAFDVGKNFRKEKYETYKAGRSETPEELKLQMPVARKILTAMGIKYYELEPFEADDIIGTFADACNNNKEYDATIISSDKDLLQLITKEVEVKLLKTKDFIRYNPESFKADWGFSPIHMIDYKALAGDSSDNIPGVKGVGDKTAINLLKTYQDLDDIYNHIDEIKGALKNKLLNDKESAYISKELATIYKKVPIDIDFTAIKYMGPNEEEISSIYNELEFYSFLKQRKVKPVKKELSFMTIMDPSEIEDTDTYAYYIEGDKENYHEANIIGMSVATKNNNYYVPKLLIKDTLEYLKDKSKYTYDLKKNICLLKDENILDKTIFDTMIASYLLEENTKDDIAYLMVPKDYKIEFYDVCLKNGFRSKDIVMKSRFIYDTRDDYIKNIKLEDMESLFNNIEMPLIKVLANMELNGIKCDSEVLKNMSLEVEKKIKDIEERIYFECGENFNIASPKQLGVILFEKLNLPFAKKNKSGAYKTDVDTLKKLVNYHPIIRDILEFRNLNKLYTTYLEGLIPYIREDGKIHTIYKQNLTRTGRLSSVEPNMQNIPAKDSEGRKIKKAFYPEYDYLLSCDYSQIELRLLAHISKSKELIRTYLNDEDIHTKVAADIHGISQSEVTPLMRKTAKAVIFGIVYGISGFGLGENLEISAKEANKFIEKYYELYPGVKKYMDEIIKEAYERGEVRTLFNRKRTIEELNNKNYMIRQQGERIALNTPIQGTCADIMKKAMVGIYESFKENNIQSKMLLQVHDELIFDVKKEEKDEVIRIVKDKMENAIKLDVPIKVSSDLGTNWYDTK